MIHYLERFIDFYIGFEARIFKIIRFTKELTDLRKEKVEK